MQLQSQAQLVLVLGYLLEYSASNQAIEDLKLRIAQRNSDKASGNYVDEDTRLEEDEKIWQNEGIDADKTALRAAEFELLGQAILTKLDNVKLSRLQENVNDKDLTLSKTANNEIYIGSVAALIGYIFNYQGAKILFDISNENATLD